MNTAFPCTSGMPHFGKAVCSGNMYTYRSEKMIPAGLSLSVFRECCNKPTAEHSHDFIEIVYIEQGEATQFVGENKYIVRRGDLLFINCGTSHRFIPDKEFTYINICVLPELIGRGIGSRKSAFGLLTLSAFEELQAGSEEGRLVVFNSDERKNFEMLLSELLEEYQNDFPERATVLESYIRIILAKILRKIIPAYGNPTNTQIMWQELLSYIDRNLNRKLTLAALAQKCFYNPAYFGRIFRETFHISVSEYIERQRISLASSLLSKTDLSIERIAEECGYGDRTVLYRAFMRIYGCTPAEFREKSIKTQHI